MDSNGLVNGTATATGLPTVEAPAINCAMVQISEPTMSNSPFNGLRWLSHWGHGSNSTAIE